VKAKIRKYPYDLKIGFRLRKSSFIELHKRAYKAQQVDHLEVCGVLVVDEERVIDLRYLENASRNSYEYEIRLADIAEIELELRSSGEWILGTFHSHPVSSAEPGVGDLERGFLNGVELIHDVCGRAAKLWNSSEAHGEVRAAEIPLAIIEG